MQVWKTNSAPLFPLHPLPTTPPANLPSLPPTKPDKEKDELVVSMEGIKGVTSKHCTDTLKDNEPEKDVEQLVTVIKEVHESRMEEDNGNLMKVTKDEFDLILKKFD